MDLQRLFRNELDAHQAVLDDLEGACAADFKAFVEITVDAVKSGSKILLCGNGGSAADAQHLAAEFVVRLRRDRAPIPAIALTTDTSILTAGANDLGYDKIFSRQVEALGRAGDVLVCFSTSGTSANILAAIEAAKRKSMKVIGLTGKTGGKMQADALLKVPHERTDRIQEMHILMGHTWCLAVEEALGLVK